MKKGRWKSSMELLFMILMSGIIIWGCKEIPDPIEEKGEVVEENSGEEEIVIDEQYLIENCGVTKEELKGVDIADFVESWVEPRRNRRGALDDAEIGRMVSSYTRCMETLEEIEERERNKKDDYAGIFAVEDDGGYKDEYQEDITVLAISQSVGTYRESVIFDLEQKVYYFGELMDISEDYSQATKSGELSDEEIADIREIIGEAGVSGWKGRTGRLHFYDNDYCTFSLTICCSDGTEYGYGGYEFPSGFGTLIVYLKELKEL